MKIINDEFEKYNLYWFYLEKFYIKDCDLIVNWIGLIILGLVCFMLGILANIVFKRQSFVEKDLRHYKKEFND